MSRTPAGLLNNAPLLLILVTLFWGGNAVAGKLAVGRVSPLLLTEFRWVITGTILLIVGQHHIRRDWPVIRKNLGKLFSMGLTGFALFNFFLYSALVHTTAINSTIIQAAMPMFIFILSFAVFRVATHWAQALGYSVTLIGAALRRARRFSTPARTSRTSRSNCNTRSRSSERKRLRPRAFRNSSGASRSSLRSIMPVPGDAAP